MLKYLNLPNWFFVVMALLISFYIAHNFSSNKPPGRAVSAASNTLIRYIVR